MTVEGPEALRRDYQAAGFAGQLAFGRRPALLLVDIVLAYLDPASPLYAGVEDQLASAQRIAATARKVQIPIVFTKVVYEPGGLDGGLFFHKVPALRAFERGSPAGDFPAHLQPQPGELVIEKQYPSAFFGTSLASTLHVAGVDCVLICGFSTSGCIRATALDALCHGIAPFVVSDACGDRHHVPNDANLFDIQSKIGEVVSETEATALVRGDRSGKHGGPVAADRDQ